MNLKNFNQIQKIQKLNQLKFEQNSKNVVVLYDNYLLQLPFFRKWIVNFPNSISLSGGESLKSVSKFSKVLNQVHKMAKSKSLDKDFVFIGVGGGSITDFVGFLASVYQRGHPVWFIPSTWLCAVDSAFGGKNGLNLLGDKNQVGTIFQPNKVFLVEELLLSQPKDRTIDGFSESIKIGIIRDPKLFRALDVDKNSIYSHLTRSIQGKLKIIQADPLETKGVRYVLNFGHTFGHVFESTLGLSHGVAVLLGQIVAVKISEDLGYCQKKDSELVLKRLLVPELRTVLRRALKLTKEQFKTKLSRDKKFKSGKMNFVFFVKVGHCTVDQIDLQTLLLSYSKISKVLWQST